MPAGTGLFLESIWVSSLKPRSAPVDTAIGTVRKRRGSGVIGMLQERTVRTQSRGDDGFTLLEVVVALVIAAVMFTALAGVSISALRGAAIARQNTQAADIGNAVLEDARTQAYAGLSMVPSDLSGDPRVLTGDTISVPDVGTEDLVVSSTGSLSPHIEEVEANNVTFTVATYVSVPNGTSIDEEGIPLAKRVTAFVTWSTYGAERTRTVSSILVETKRGLPLPDYTVALRTPSCSSWNTGSTQRPVFSVLFRNVGARDSFDLSMTTSSNDSGNNWSYYTSDPTLSGATLATDTSGNGKVDTGLIEPYKTKEIWIRRDSTLSAGTTVTLRLHAQSTAQPSATTAVVNLPVSSSATLSVTSVSGNVTTCGSATTSPTPSASPTSTLPTADSTCPSTPSAVEVSTSAGYSAHAFGLNNGDGTIDGDTTAPSFATASNGSTTKDNSMVMDNCMPQSISHDFSTNLGSTGYTSGRALQPGGTGSSTAAAGQQVEWQMFPTSLVRVGDTTHYLSVMVQCTQTSPTSGTLAASLWTLKNAGYNALFSSSTGNTATYTCASGNAWQRVNVPIPVPAATAINSGSVKGLAVRLWAPSGPTVRVGYDLMAGDDAANKSFASLQVRFT